MPTNPSAEYTPKQVETFNALRDRYLLVMSWELTAERFEMDTWFSMLHQVFMDVREAGFKIAEVTHP